MTNVEHNISPLNGNLTDKIYHPASPSKVTFDNHNDNDNGDDLTDDNGQTSNFTRGVHDSNYNSGFSSRLSTVIRRSLRLGPKRSSGSGNRSSSSRFKSHHSFIEDKVCFLL